MCGVAGYSGTGLSLMTRAIMVAALGQAIQRRGNHAWGYAGHTGERTIARKGLGSWTDAPLSEVLRAASAETCILHSRYATHGSKSDRENAHPFTIRRNNQIVLHGIHNGVLHGTEETAKAAGREHTVDSRELYELMADGKHSVAEEKLTGYGVLLWVVPRSEIVRVMLLTDDADFAMARLNTGGLMWASTEALLKESASDAGLTIADMMPKPKSGVVYGIYHGNIRALPAEPGIRLKRHNVRSWDSYTDRAQVSFGSRVKSWAEVYRAEDSVSYLPTTRNCVPGTNQSLTYGDYTVRVDSTDVGGRKLIHYFRYDDWGRTWKYLENRVCVRDEDGFYWTDAHGGKVYAEWDDAALCEHGLPPDTYCESCDGDDSVPATLADTDYCEHGVRGDAECDQCLTDAEFGPYTLVNSDQETG